MNRSGSHPDLENRPFYEEIAPPGLLQGMAWYGGFSRVLSRKPPRERPIWVSGVHGKGKGWTISQNI